MSYLITNSMKKIDVLTMTPDDVDIEDIANSLANTCRWGGHMSCDRWYSVAQHSVLCAAHCSEPKWALLHDAAEAYLTDMPYPIKIHLDEFNRLEEHVQKIIAERFDLTLPMPACVKKIDYVLYRTEIRDLFDDAFKFDELLAGVEPLFARIVPWSPEQARRTFLEWFHEFGTDGSPRGSSDRLHA